MRRHLADGQRHRFRPRNLAENVGRKTGPISHADSRPALQIRQGECGRAVAAVRRPEEREERRILIDGQNLAGT
jgi:hypothetical protein